jgi:hypothetical protein
MYVFYLNPISKKLYKLNNQIKQTYFEKIIFKKEKCIVLKKKERTKIKFKQSRAEQTRSTKSQKE